ncbi:MAG: sigma-54 dependent transcriptional regulator [Candidatus Scalindua sp.]
MNNKKNIKEKIFIIDDEQIITFMLKKFLSEEGYDVDTANDINEAKAGIGHKDYDLIITDIILGAETGVDLLREIKKMKLTCPVVFITGNPNIDTASDAVRLGAYDYLPKPVRNETLLRTVKNALQHKALIDENIKYRSNLEAIFKSIKDAIITVDKDLVILELNESAEEICGFPGDAKGKKYESFLSGCSGKCLDALNETINTKLPADRSCFECNNQRGPRRVVSVTTFPLFNPQEEFNGCVMVVKDETKLVDLESDLHERHQLQNIIGKSEKIQKVYSSIEALAEVQTTVLITGESGTGKGLVSEALHYHKRSTKSPFVVVNCAALSDNLLESELFGHVKGAFTGAVNDRIGRFQKADGGTIFLDEVGDISNTMQLRLLRVLQEMEFERVGDSTSIKVNVRIIAATNQDLRKKVRQGKFREDLYHRLKVVELTIPPLRERREDISLLVDHFLEKFNKKFNKNIKSISADVQRIFMDYKWPGNIRELQHTLEYAFVLCNQPFITIDNLPSEFQNLSTDGIRPLEKRKPYDRHTITQALKETGWNKAKAARLLGIGRRTIYLKIKEYGITEIQ